MEGCRECKNMNEMGTYAVRSHRIDIRYIEVYNQERLFVIILKEVLIMCIRCVICGRKYTSKMFADLEFLGFYNNFFQGSFLELRKCSRCGKTLGLEVKPRLPIPKPQEGALLPPGRIAVRSNKGGR